MSICSSPTAEAPSQATQTSVRQMIPRLVDHVGPSNSRTSIPREAPVISTPRLSPSLPSPGWFSDSAALPSRRLASRERFSDSESLPRADRSLRPMSRSAECLSAAARTTPRMERDRASVRELASFLANNDPPPNNRMSEPEPAPREPSSHCLKGSLSILHKLNRKKSTTSPRLLRLPDSAVAAKTSQGTLHIAISIPLEYDHMEHLSRPNKPLPPLPPSQRSSNSVHRKGPITVLKPITEESARNASLNSSQNLDMVSSDASQPLPTVRVSSSHPLLGQASGVPNKSFPVRAESPDEMPEPAARQRSFVAVSPITVSRQSSQRTDPRHSGDTAYSEKSWDTDTGVSKGSSSASTAPSAKQPPQAQGVTIDPPKRASSITRKAGLATSARAEGVRPSRSSDPSIGLLDTISPSNLNVANLSSHRTGSAEVVVKIRSAPRAPAPTRALPDLPEGGEECRSSLSRKEAAIMKRSANAMTNGKPTEASVQALSLRCQTRQERVKALKMRDIAALKSKQSSKQLAKAGQNTETESSSTSKTRASGTSPRQTKRRSQSSPLRQNDSSRRRISSVISPIMLVADLEPHSGIYQNSDFVFPAPPAYHVKTRSRPANESPKPCLTTRAVTPSLASSDDESVFIARHPPRRTSPSHGKHLKRGEDSKAREAKHEMTLQERNLESRLRRIEDTHAMMLETLEAVGLGFKELNRLMSLNMLNSGEPPFRRSLTGHPDRPMDTVQPVA